MTRRFAAVFAVFFALYVIAAPMCVVRLFADGLEPRDLVWTLVLVASGVGQLWGLLWLLVGDPPPRRR